MLTNHRSETYVALKIAIADSRAISQEHKVLNLLQNIDREQPGARHVMRSLERFLIDGPNGSHDCFVLELLGPSVADLLGTRYGGRRLPGGPAKRIARQSLEGLSFLHSQGIGHGG
jgi:serine/threonine-protein kinase SRPK3